MDIDGKVDRTSAMEVEPSTNRIEDTFILMKYIIVMYCVTCHPIASFNTAKVDITSSRSGHRRVERRACHVLAGWDDSFQ